MAWENLDEDIAEEFSGLVRVDIDVYRDGAPMHLVWKRKRRPISALPLEQKARALARNERWARAQRVKRRDAKRAALAAPVCIRPGCGRPLEAPGVLRPGPVPQTCSQRCSNAVAYYRRIGRLPPRP